MDRESLMRQVMSYDLVALELVLFLDTHPHDVKALEMHAAVVKKAAELRKQYEEQFGPITSNAVTSTERWTWIDSPWPWEN